MKKIIFYLSVLALLSGLSGSFILFRNGLPSEIKRERISYKITEQEPDNIDEIKINNKKIQKKARLGIFLIGACFSIQLGVLIIEHIWIKKK
jgi:hypothetical protein